MRIAENERWERENEAQEEICIPVINYTTEGRHNYQEQNEHAQPEHNILQRTDEAISRDTETNSHNNFVAPRDESSTGPALNVSNRLDSFSSSGVTRNSSAIVQNCNSMQQVDPYQQQRQTNDQLYQQMQINDQILFQQRQINGQILYQQQWQINDQLYQQQMQINDRLYQQQQINDQLYQHQQL